MFIDVFVVAQFLRQAESVVGTSVVGIWYLVFEKVRSRDS
jgi:hypothetical protein